MRYLDFEGEPMLFQDFSQISGKAKELLCFPRHSWELNVNHDPKKGDINCYVSGVVLKWVHTSISGLPASVLIGLDDVEERG